MVGSGSANVPLAVAGCTTSLAVLGLCWWNRPVSICVWFIRTFPTSSFVASAAVLLAGRLHGRLRFVSRFSFRCHRFGPGRCVGRRWPESNACCNHPWPHFQAGLVRNVWSTSRYQTTLTAVPVPPWPFRAVEALRRKNRANLTPLLTRLAPECESHPGT
jgi:hypothetical protein